MGKIANQKSFEFLSKIKKEIKGKNIKKETFKNPIIEPYPFEGERKRLVDLTERQYDALYDKSESLYDLFLERADELEEIFDETQSKSRRLKALKSAFSAFDKCYQVVAPYWYEDPYFMDLLAVKTDDSWRMCTDEVANNMAYNFYSIFCIMWLIKKYEKNAN